MKGTAPKSRIAPACAAAATTALRLHQGGKTPAATWGSGARLAASRTAAVARATPRLTLTANVVSLAALSTHKLWRGRLSDCLTGEERTRPRNNPSAIQSRTTRLFPRETQGDAATRCRGPSGSRPRRPSRTCRRRSLPAGSSRPEEGNRRPGRSDQPPRPQRRSSPPPGRGWAARRSSAPCRDGR
jgi:hypothetical protein